ncbi:hypothetical protein BJ912DRAFT_350608 [Pholiota molesta]|nr:hypothetical protein BJ912DRAFT_350608 [Pholiota molesta]
MLRYSSVYEAFLSLCLFFWTCMMKGVASIVRAFNTSGPLIELPVTTHVISVSYVTIVRGHAQRLVVKPIAKLYNTVDNFIFQTYGYVAWNSPRYMARVKNAFQYIRTIVRKYIWTERVPAEHRCPSPRHPGSTPGLSPTITDRDSVWIEWGTPTLPDEGNEWSFYIRGSGDRQGISVTQSAWKGYQDYMQQLGCRLLTRPLASPFRTSKHIKPL